MANTKYTPCSDLNLGITASAFSAESTEFPIIYGGREYKSIESFDVNNMPMDIFAKKPNFVIAFAGTKVKNGIDTGIPCVVIGVHKKVNVAELDDKDIIPRILPDGVITDIVEFPKIEAFPTCTDGSGDGCPPHDESHRPLQGGTSAMEETGTACTLGLVVKDSTTDSLVALTNNHCVGLLYDPVYSAATYGSTSVAGNNMMQPSPSDGGDVADIYGTVVRAVALKFDAGQTNLVDCAISSIGTDDASTKIYDINDGPYSFASKSEYTTGTELHKSGRTTGVTPPPTTTITDDDALVTVSYGPSSNDDAYFNHVIVYQSTSRFSQGGDSGSAMLAVISGSYKVVALNFAGNVDGTVGIGCHISDVSSALSVEAWDGDIVVTENTSPSVMVNEVCYELVGSTTDSITHTVDDQFSSCLACESQSANSSSSSSSVTVSSSSSNSSSSSDSSTSLESESSSSTVANSTSSSLSSVSSSSSSSDSSESSSSSTLEKSTSSTSNVSLSSSSSEFEEDFSHRIPKGLLFEVSGQNEITLRWRSLRGANGYSIERKEGFYEWKSLGETAYTYYVDSSLIPGKYYQYRIRGYIDG